MKIGILTYHFSDNYGALFQAYGLRSWLIEQGFKAEFINYKPAYVESSVNFSLSNIFTKTGLTILFLKFVNMREKYFGNTHAKEGFKDFRRELLGIKGEEFNSMEELNSARLDYDVLICGSDQIWNPSEAFGVDPVYFLDFKTKKSNIKRISYAPSFGKNILDKKFSSEINSLISKLDGVSIRESSGKKIIEQLINKKISLVPDPTTLVLNYQKIMSEYNVKKRNYIFCYYLRSRINIGETAEYIANKLNLGLYSPHNPHRRWREIGETIYPNPKEWLYLLDSSKFVITNSFHGTILSILLNKPFIVVGINGAKSTYNERAINILKLCNLENRLIQNFDINKIDQLLIEEIDWDSVNKTIKLLRQEGIDFLMSHLYKDNV